MIKNSRSHRGAVSIAGAAILLGALVLALLGGSASATELPPENVSPPTTSGTYVGQLAISTSGSWKNSPTSYSAQWERCLSTCTAIAGANGWNYLIVPADSAYSLRFAETATNAAGSTTVYSAKVQVKRRLGWWVCAKSIPHGDGIFEDANCSVPSGTGLYFWQRSNPGSATLSSETYILDFTLSEQHAKITCSTGEGHGTLKNTSERATMNETELSLGNCTVGGGGFLANCKVPGGNIILKGNGQTPPPTIPSEGPPKSEMTFEAASGSLIAFSLEGCAGEYFNGAYTVTGSLTTEVHSAGLYMSSTSSATKKQLTVHFKSETAGFGIEGATSIHSSGPTIKLDTFGG